MLKRVSIQNFKSLKDVTLDLQKVNLLIGPNNSGKTNFLKALEIVNTLSNSINYFGKNLFFKKNVRYAPSLYFIFENHFPWSESGELDHYKISNKSNDSLFSDEIFLKVSEGSNKNLDEIPNDFNELDLSDVSNRFFKNLQYMLQNVRVYNINTFELTRPYPLIPNNELVSYNANNIIAFLDTLRDKFPDNFSKIQENLKLCLPEFTQIRFDTVEPDEDIKNYFGDKTFKKLGLYQDKQKTTYWSDELSEGTLYFIALLCIINQPNPPKLLLLEEPEKGIHPRRIFEVIQFIFQLAEEKDVQVIMTTHSPIVVDMFKDMPESVFIFDKDDEGATHVKNLQRDIIEPETEKSRELGIEPHHYTDSLGDAWTVGFLGGVPK